MLDFNAEANAEGVKGFRKRPEYWPYLSGDPHHPTGLTPSASPGK
jgi:hypothetical protein